MSVRPMRKRYELRTGIVGATLEEELEPAKKTPTIEIIKALTPTSLAVAAVVSNAHHAVLYSLAGLSAAGVFYDHVKDAVLARKDKSHNKNVVKRNLKQFRTFSEELGPFLNTELTRSDTFAGIANAIKQKHPQIQYRFPIPPVEVFYNNWYFLNSRIQRDDFTPEQFHGAVKELWNVLSGWSLYCVYRSYEVFAQNSSVIDSQYKSQFNAFQQNWTAFITGWLKFIKQLNKELTGFEPLPLGVNMPLPLT